MSVLAMMFVVLFGSLAAAMAIVAKGNLRTAQTHLHVIRAMNAAETGMAVARERLSRAVARFVVSKGVVDDDFGSDIWSGSLDGGDGTVDVLPAQGGASEDSQPSGIADALVSAHNAETNILTLAGYPEETQIHDAADDVDDTVYRTTDWVTTAAVAIDGAAGDDAMSPAAYQITYAPLANGTDVRIFVTGYSSLNSRGSGYHYGGQDSGGVYRPLTRTVSADFRVVKRHKHAIVSPSRIMIGKDVHVEGDLGAVYTDVAQNNGHPMVLRSDFTGIDGVLDEELEDLFAALVSSDVDGDNRLRVGHSTEGAGLPPAADYNGDGASDNPFTDVTGDGYVDEMDVFINRFDANHDGRLVLSSALTNGTPADGQAAEFTADDDLALLIDSIYPDRNRNGVSGFRDDNLNGRWDQGEAFNDLDARHDDVAADQVLGYRDGIIDRKDQYSKVHGRLLFRAGAQDWTDAQGDYQQYLRGPIDPGDDSAVRFQAPDDELPMIDGDTFQSSESALQGAADGDSFAEQVATQLGISVADLATYTESDTDSAAVRYFREDMADATVMAMTGRHLFEKMPFNAPAFTDWYYRPRYENMVFKDVQIPMGCNALFNNCTFVGVTWIRSYTANTHVNWTAYGRMEWNDSANHPVLVDNPLDKSDFLRYTTGNVVDGPANYDSFPDPPVINGSTVTGAARNTKLYSNNIRFHDCLFVGSIISDTPTEYTNVRNKLQFTGSTRFATQHPDDPDDPDLNPEEQDVSEILKSSMLLPNYSVDIGSFNSPTDTFEEGAVGQNVQLHGTVVAGVLDMRGTASIDGTLMLTFAPTAGEGPLQQNGQAVGNPAGFNTTIGYFGPEDGDEESLDPNELPVVNGHRIVGYDLDGDGISDTDPDYTPSAADVEAGATAVPFQGYGRITLKWNPDLPMPDGIMLPLSVVEVAGTYREGRHE